jgi:hypothetical protein
MLTKTSERAAFSPVEFAALFGKSQTWGYRQIYSGSVKAITEHGRILIPAAEVEAILVKAGIYDGLKKAEKPRRNRTVVSKFQRAWAQFVEERRQGVRIAVAKESKLPAKIAKDGSERRNALERLQRSQKRSR